MTGPGSGGGGAADLCFVIAAVADAALAGT